MTNQQAHKAKLVAPSRPGIYSRGSDTVDAILRAALHVLIEEGASAFTLRRIATECGLKVGNVSRHFPRKEMLVQVLLEELLSPNAGEVRSYLKEAGRTPEESLAIVIGGSLDEISTKKMTHLFTELWAMANHNAFVAERVEMVYRFTHGLIASFVAELNPALSPGEVEIVSVYISATIEGSTVVAGYGRLCSDLMPQIRAIAIKQLVAFAKNVTPEEIRALPSA